MFRCAKFIPLLCLCLLLCACAPSESAGIDPQNTPLPTETPVPSEEPEPLPPQKERILGEGEFILLPGGGPGQSALYDEYGDMVTVLTLAPSESGYTLYHRGDIQRIYNNESNDVFSLETMDYLLKGCKDELYVDEWLDMYCIINDTCSLYDNTGKLVYSVQVPQNDAKDYWVNFMQCGDDILLSVMGVYYSDDLYEEKMLITPRLIGPDGSCKLVDRTFYESDNCSFDMKPFGEYYYCLCGNHYSLKDAQGNIVLDDVSAVYDHAGPYVRYVYNSVGGKLYDEKLNVVGECGNYLGVCYGEYIDGCEYTIDGITYTGLYNVQDCEEPFLYTVDQGIFIYHDGQAYKVEDPEALYVIDFNREFVSYAIDVGDERYARIVHFKDGARFFPDSEFDYQLQPDCILSYNYDEETSESTMGIYDLNGNLLYTQKEGYASYLRPGVLRLRRGNYVGLATYDGKWLVKAVSGIYE